MNLLRRSLLIAIYYVAEEFQCAVECRRSIKRAVVALHNHQTSRIPNNIWVTGHLLMALPGMTKKTIETSLRNLALSSAEPAFRQALCPESGCSGLQ